ncbi:helix-turn-helix domain-containing protein [Streptomyces sp. NBC_01500]|uniref:helix-turn-helix domain-containing protein n=1 Tax=Streptomyces sp. NBC_01500 TaxID=2903886 RepID=UPI00225C07D6|nr:helix-turn-helix domain-containing protein [Streptomyces sp. NBC_01500]MCX4554291.1 helix-turn-helix domain-containing protein [Streptomyces sp. NBC_01500]
MLSPRLPVGERIRYYRRKNGNRKQAAIAGLCGITERYLSLIENGQKTPSADVLSRIAHELGVPITALLTEEPPPSQDIPTTTEHDVARALMGHGPPRSTTPAEPATLRERVEQAWQMWQSSPHRYTDAAQILPALINDVEHATRVHRHGSDPAARREVLRTAADMYGLLRSYCRRTGRLDLSLMVADRAMRAAEDADDPVRIAAASWNLGHVLLSDGREGAVEEAAEVALQATEQLGRETDSPETAAMHGALELVAVVADARQHDWWQARDRLEKKATPLAKAAAANVQWTVFGATNIDLHAMSIEMMAGEASEGLKVADSIDTSQLASRERRFTFTLEMARCYDMRRDDAAVLVHILGLEELSPEDLARSPLALSMITSLLKRVRPTYRAQVTGLAERLNLT